MTATPAPAEPTASTPRRKRAGWLVAIALPVIGGAIALPKLLSTKEGETEPAPAAAAPPAKKAPADAPKASSRADAAAPEKEAAPSKPAIEVSADGDLAPSLSFKWKAYEAGERIAARVVLTNHSTKEFHVPAPGEPNPGLVLVVRDADGNEVRRVVETARDQALPRRTLRLKSGSEVEIPVTVVAEGETPLPPGEYTASVELRADPALRRLGLPVWTGPKGPVSSALVPLVVTAKGN